MKALVLASLRHYRGLHLLVAGGVGVAVAVLAGALLVGGSVRASLRDLALARLGATDIIVSSIGFFREQLADDLHQQGIGETTPLLALTGSVTHEESRRTAARVNVFGIDDRFLAFHGRERGTPTERDSWISSGLASELGVETNDTLILRVAKPTDIPLSNLQGRREDVSERVRLTVERVVDRAGLGEFSLQSTQGPAFSIFVPLSRLQQDLGLRGQVNALLVHVPVTAGGSQELAATQVASVQQAVKTSAHLEDIGLSVRTNHSGKLWILEGRTGLLPETIWRQAAEAARGPSVGALTYLANSIRAGDRAIPYSLIAAIDINAYNRLGVQREIQEIREKDRPTVGPATLESSSAFPPIWLNEWAAEDLAAPRGARIDVDYYLWSEQDGLQTRSTPFTLAGLVPMSGAGGDQTLTPEYPGITDAGDVRSWDPPFPVDLSKVRKKDEDYWDTWRSAPKAFIPLEVGQRLWPSPFGSLSSLRTTRRGDAWPSIQAFDIFAAGITVRHARSEALAAAAGTTDFGEYFIYFSFFLVVSGLLLAGMFFALSVEQRAMELGLLLAVGYRVADLRRTLLAEAAVLAGAGCVMGIAGAVGYAALIMHGLRTWWVGAVGTRALELHIDPWLLIAGAAGAAAAAVLALFLSFRRVGRRSARSLLTAGLALDETPRGEFKMLPFVPLSVSRAIRRSRPRAITIAGTATALALIGLAIARLIDQVPAFFGAGALLLIAGCAAFATWLRRGTRHSPPHTSVFRFGAAYARWRPTRSVLSAALIAFACFVIVAVSAFRRDPAGSSVTRQSGTGGFVLMAESVAPLMYNPNTAEGREELSLAGYDELNRTRIARFRLRPGDEASCLTLYQPHNPRVVAPEASFLEESRFSFARSLAETAEERANPWRLLNRRFGDGAVPAIADQTSLTYVFHLGIGDDFVFTPGGSSPVRLRIVGTLADSVLQSELIIGEHDFVRLFPRHEGYRLWFVEAPETDASDLTTLLEDRLSDFGVDVTDTRARLASYHQVENTYLSTFQALGAFGLMLGTLGLAAMLARNVLERRRELGLLGAIGFTRGHLRTVVTAESLLLVGCGVVIGTLAALVAIAPAIAERGESLPAGRLALLLTSVVTIGLLAAIGAVRLATSMRVIEALRTE